MYVLSRAPFNQQKLSKMQDKARHMQQVLGLGPGKMMYTVSAAVRFNGPPQSKTAPAIPVFGYPRTYSDRLVHLNDIQERFEERDMAPIFMSAVSASTLRAALDVIFEATPPERFGERKSFSPSRILLFPI